MKTAHDVIIKPIITENSMEMAGNKKYVFKVLRDASKTEIRYAVEEVFKVKVKDVNTISMPGKKKRLGSRKEGTTPAWKKAIVTLAPDSGSIAFFDGMF